MSVFLICITALNVFLWIIFIIRFKKLFSTDKVIEKAADKINKMIKDLDASTERDLYLSSEANKRIQQSIKETEEKMVLFKEASQRLRDMIAEADKINKFSNQNTSLFQDFNKINNTDYAKNINAYIKNSVKNNSPKVQIDPDSAYEVTPSSQPDLFSSEVEKSKSVLKDETILTPDGTAYKEVPLIITKVYNDDIVTPNESTQPQLENKKNILTKQILQLHDNGLSVEEIAIKLSKSITEVQMIIDINI